MVSIPKQIQTDSARLATLFQGTLKTVVTMYVTTTSQIKTVFCHFLHDQSTLFPFVMVAALLEK